MPYTIFCGERKEVGKELKVEIVKVMVEVNIMNGLHYFLCRKDGGRKGTRLTLSGSW
jgi:hypothetical protein